MRIFTEAIKVTDSRTGQRRKAVIRTVIDYGVFDGETVEIIPSYREIAGVNLASRRGVEPLYSP